MVWSIKVERSMIAEGVLHSLFVFLFCYKYMQMKNAETKYFVLLILITIDKYDL